MGAVAICLAASFIAGCGGSQRRAVKEAVRDHLKQDTHLAAGRYSTQIERVTFSGNSADALVRFESKQSSKLFVEIHYGLRVENGRWEVVSSTPVGGLGGDSHRPLDDNPPAPQPAQPGSNPQASH
jgi:hypothetical protein